MAKNIALLPVICGYCRGTIDDASDSVYIAMGIAVHRKCEELWEKSHSQREGTNEEGLDYLAYY